MNDASISPVEGWVIVGWFVLANLAVVYAYLVRPWFLTWGASSADLERAMPADAQIREPMYTTTLAVTIDARPEHVWPWLLQMGYRRGGLYSYDWLDRLFGFLDRPSATRILPEYQDLRVGQEIPVGRGNGFPVRAIVPGRVIVLGGQSDGFVWYWQIGLYPIDADHTRLVSRNTAVYPSSFHAWLFMRVLEAAAFIMTRRMLRGLKWRAERLAAEETLHPRAA